MNTHALNRHTHTAVTIGTQSGSFTVTSHLDPRFDQGIREAIFHATDFGLTGNGLGNGIPEIEVYGYSGKALSSNGWASANGFTRAGGTIPPADTGAVRVFDGSITWEIKDIAILDPKVFSTHHDISNWQRSISANVYIDLDNNPKNVNRTILHEFLHHSEIVDKISQDLFRGYIVENTLDLSSFSRDQFSAALSSFEHLVISRWVESVQGQYPDIFGRGGQSYAQYLRDLQNALKNQNLPASSVDFSQPFGDIPLLGPEVIADIPSWVFKATPGDFVAFSTAAKDGVSFRDDGNVHFWKGADGVARPTFDGSAYSENLLNNYGRAIGNGDYSGLTFGGHLRALGDWLGFDDGKFGVQGSFARDGEGKNRGGESQRTDSSNVGNWGGDRDGDGVANWRDFDDGVGYADNQNRKENDSDSDGGGGRSKPVLLDLDGDGIDITSIDDSLVFMDANGDGLESRTAWAGAGDGVLFFDADGDGTISEAREYILTEWDPTATSDIDAVRSVFDSNGDGVLDAQDADWVDFKVLVTLSDGSLVARTLAELGIESIDLTADATQIELPDGSVITGQTTFTRTDGTTGTVADTTLATGGQSYRVEKVESAGARTLTQTGYNWHQTACRIATRSPPQLA